ncbi:phospholipase D/nuclease [Ophiobolus disseminans]|uniref:Phospholipase D/nuclease n=1 Tax=Ophiobolus disseminans TaxID=1469910 RepID=A0A6A6ZT76_9PLEO|nr:phospholipase D/nuclease [Ophiobolus disseminans]
MTSQDSEQPAKRRRLNANVPNLATAAEHHHAALNRPISPPASNRKNLVREPVLTPSWGFGNVRAGASIPVPPDAAAQQDRPAAGDGVKEEDTEYLSSPTQLTRIEDMAPHQNIDAVGLQEILGDPLIKECWNFNYLFDIDFVMKHFDSDVRDLVTVKIIHGFWKNEDENRISLLEAGERYPNVQLIPAYIPDTFGTHHSKMIVLFRHDDCAQIVIHTANMITRDWGNMTQAVWKSPLLPLLTSTDASNLASPADVTAHSIGNGERFKVDFTRYLKAYGNRLKPLVTLLDDYDFSAIRAAFIGSAPSRQKPATAQPLEQTSFGWLGLQEILSTIPVKENLTAISPPHIVIQISSIATLGAAPTWLTCLQSALARSAVCTPTPPAASAFFKKREPSSPQSSKQSQKPTFNIIFPTPNEIRTSLDGYGSGASIHIKLQSQQQQKSQEYLHPLFCHWKAPSTPSTSKSSTERHGEALRGPAAPHIKVYVRFGDHDHKTIDWAMLTSANLSKQAWGDVVNKKDEIWIQSWEAGVVVWPALLAEEDAAKETIMVPVFGKDMPGPEDVVGIEGANSKTVVGFRMPYDLPLSPYASTDTPWCATMQYLEPDWKGMAWAGYGK